MSLAELQPSPASSLVDILDANMVVGPMRDGPKRFWTGREHLILRNHYPVLGLAGCIDKLPGRSAKAIYQQARLIGLVSAATAKQTGPRQRWATSEAIDSVILQAYPRAIHKNDVQKLAQTVGRPGWWVTRRATKLGLVQSRFRDPPWSDAELAYLGERAHQDPQTIAIGLKRFGTKRTAAAIVVKIKRQGLTTEDPDHFTSCGLAKVMGIDSKSVSRWIVKGWLKAKRRGTDRTETQGGDQWWIHRKDVRRFIIENVGAVDIRKVDKFWLVELLTGVARS